MIVATPLDLPTIKPDSWEVFWDIWNKHAALLYKTHLNGTHSESVVGSQGVWKGMDIFTAGDTRTAWQAPFVNIEDSLPELYKTCCSLPVKNLYRVRLIESIRNVKAHSDDNIDKWSIRAYFHYTDLKPQWYFTKPEDPLGDRYYFGPPEDTNWFAYNDKHCWHGTDYDVDHPKILLQVYAIDTAESLVYNSIPKYQGHTVSI